MTPNALLPVLFLIAVPHHACGGGNNLQKASPGGRAQARAAGRPSVAAARQALSRPADPPPYYSCPDSPDGPLVYLRPGRRTLLANSEAGLLCTLSRVTVVGEDVTGSGGSGGGSSTDDDGEGEGGGETKTLLAPVGRSYDGRNWERVAGPYRALRYDCGGAAASSAASSSADVPYGGTLCEVDVPPADPNQVFVLTTFNHTLTDRDAVARFLQQTTFGPRRSDLDGWNYDGGTLDRTFADWTREQMYDVPPTLHRAFWRERANPRFVTASAVGRPWHPCERYSRWRDVAFTAKDYGRYVTLVPLVASAPTGPAVLSVDGHVRTVADGLGFADGAYKVDLAHSYEICGRPEGWVGGELRLRQPDESCQKTEGGNMRLALKEQVVANSPGIMIVDLPALNRDSMVPLEDRPTSTPAAIGGEWMLNIELSQNVCDGIPLTGSEASVFGRLPDGEYLLHDPRLSISSNTLSDPLPDGGGATARATGGAIMCSNVARTFQNEDYCKLSTEALACTNKDEASGISVALDLDTIPRFFELTGRYVYTIEGLRGETGEVSSPCVPGTRSRWVRISPDNISCGRGQTLNPDTVAVLSGLIKSSKDENPTMIDIYFPESDMACNETDANTIGMEIEIGETCWKQVHADHHNVYDFTYWTREDTHPGNAGKMEEGEPNPIKAPAEGGSASLVFPSHHSMDRWSTFKEDFVYVGRLGDTLDFRDLPDQLRLDAVAKEFGGTEMDSTGEGMILCGSPGEVANDPSLGTDTFDVTVDRDTDSTENDQFVQQRKTVWTTVVLTAPDQLRQRMAWALSQLLAISPSAIEARRNSEIFLSYYDIFVRHSFGNYRDVLREVAFSPMMAEMLSYLQSKSMAYVWERENRVAYADENFAREVMQLFSIGLVQLNADGTPVLDSYGETIPVYNNDDVMSFARSWTGFDRRRKRSNIEDYTSGSNRIDPMKIVPEWRDVFPKTDLSGGYIGDGYPRCIELPSQMFLRKGARYRLLGRSSSPELQNDPKSSAPDGSIKRVELDSASSLRRALCNPSGISEDCEFSNQVVLDTHLQCSGIECDLDNVRVVQVSQDIFYEYIRPPCVEMALYSNGIVVRGWRGKPNVCANPLLSAASEACCTLNSERAVRSCRYTGETLTLARAKTRCAAMQMSICDFERIPSSSCDECCFEPSHHWTNVKCSIQIKIDMSGKVALVHDAKAGDDDSEVMSNVRRITKNYFRVRWSNDVYPLVSNGCDNGLCEAADGACICDVTVSERQVFSEMPSEKSAKMRLFIGSLEPDAYNYGSYVKSTQGVDGVFAHHLSGDASTFSTDTVFEVHDEIGVRFFKNVESIVHIRMNNGDLANYSFRNPPHFMSLFDPEIRDAAFETDAVLDAYLYHKNTAPFLATRFIQRFGHSNPSPRLIETVASAFRSGSYLYVDSSESIEYGDGKYGSLAATAAAIVLDPEFRSILLDADPSHGSIREPLLGLIAFMRTMEYEGDAGHDLIELWGIENRIGQMAHEIPSVFSFFLPEFAPPGPVASASLVSPETQILSMPTIVSMLNGIFSLIKYGLLECEDGFGPKPEMGCSRLVEGDYSRSVGRLKYLPNRTDDADFVVDELATLLTAGRLSVENRKIIKEMFNRQSDKNFALRIAQQLMVTSPEYSSNGLVEKNIGKRPASQTQLHCRPYKAIVFLMLRGACDSHNLLVPHSQCVGKDMYEEYKAVRNEVALEKDSLLKIDTNNSSQPCGTFGLHPRLPVLHKLFTEKSAVIVANVGVLTKPVTKVNHMRETNIQLYSHEHMQQEMKRLDPFQNATGTGLLGRMADVLRRQGFAIGAVSFDENSEALIGRFGRSSSSTVIKERNIERFDPKPSSEHSVSAIKYLNEATSWRSGLFAETWSSILRQSLAQNSVVSRFLSSTEVRTTFPKTSLGRQLEAVTRLVAARKCRGMDRDVFYVEMGSFDHHSDLMDSLDDKFSEMDEAIDAFVAEMQEQGEWENVVLAATSDFGRTLTPNSGGGTDHAWAGNYFLLGGGIKGGDILGTYPNDLTENGPLNVGRGRLLPTTSWDAVFNGIARWFGITDEASLNEILPNRRNFDNLFTDDDLFIGTESKNVTCLEEELELLCKFDEGEGGKARDDTGHGITHFAGFLLLIVGIVALAAFATWMWRRKSNDEERSRSYIDDL